MKFREFLNEGMIGTKERAKIAEIAKSELIEEERYYTLSDKGIKEIAEFLNIDTEEFLGKYVNDIMMAIPTDNITKSIRFPRIKKMREIIGS